MDADGFGHHRAVCDFEPVRPDYPLLCSFVECDIVTKKRMARTDSFGICQICCCMDRKVAKCRSKQRAPDVHQVMIDKDGKSVNSLNQSCFHSGP